jgi:hypothetical protein
MIPSRASTRPSAQTGTLLLLALLAASHPANAQTNESWTGASGGLWNVAGNWSGDVVPDNGVPSGSTYNVTINNGSLVNLNTPVTISNLTVASSNTLDIENGEALTIAGTSLSNGGTVSLGSTVNNTLLVIGGSNVTLSGGGTVTLTNSGTNYIYGATYTDTLTNEETISGGGHIGNDSLTLVNSGIIDSNGTAGLVLFPNGGTTNTGTIEATAGSTLELYGTTVTNTGGNLLANTGTLQVEAATVNGGTVTLTGASTLQLSNGIVQGGTLANSATGTIEVVAGSNTLGGTITNPAGGILKIDNGAVLNLLAGSYPTLGTVQLNSGVSTTSLVADGTNVTLSGGTVTLTNSATNYIYGATYTDTLTNEETISGAGHIGNDSLTLVNSGTIDANGSAGMQIQANGGLTNSGTLLVGTGDLMHVFGGTFSNFASGTLTGGTYSTAGTLEIDQLGTTGSEIVDDAAAIILTGSGSIVDADSKDALVGLTTIATTGSFILLGGRNFTTAGSFTNDGILSVGAGSTFAVGGTGSLTNFSGTTLTGGTYDVTGTLEFPGADIVKNAANITLTGTAAKIENSTNSANALAGFASNAAKSSFALAGDADFTTAGNFSNKGTLTVGSGSTFAVGGSLTNFSGTTLTAGTFDVSGTFEFAGANIVTNAARITLTGAASKILNSTNSANGLANLATNEATGTFILAGKRSFTTTGNFSTAGVVTIGSGSTFSIGGPGAFTQTAGTTTDNGTLAASGGVALSGGALFGGGTITGNLASSGVITPGASAAKTGILTDSGAYTQNAGGSLDITIGGTAGTKFDELNSTTASLGGTLNIAQAKGYVPTVGSTFKILNFSSETGTFAAVNGLTINGTEAYTITYQPTDVLLTVVSTGAPATSDSPRLAAALARFNAANAGGAPADAVKGVPLPRTAQRVRTMDLIKQHR